MDTCTFGLLHWENIKKAGGQRASCFYYWRKYQASGILHTMEYRQVECFLLGGHDPFISQVLYAFFQYVQSFLSLG